MGTGRPDWWEGEKAREQAGGGLAAVLGSGRVRLLCVMDAVFPVKKEAGLYAKRRERGMGAVRGLRKAAKEGGGWQC